MKKRRFKLISLFRLVAVIALILLAAVIVTFNVCTDAARAKQRSESLRDDYINQQKALIKREVMRAVALINEQRSHAEEETRAVVRQRTEEAITIAENIYQQNRAIKSEAEIKKMIVDALRPIRFANGAGYYFATRLDGYEVLFADKPELEGTSLLEVKDTNGQFVVKDMIAIANGSGEGFYGYHWTKPGVVGKQHKKVAYIKLFKPFSWFIGTGAYVEDTDLRIKRALLQTLSTIRFGENGYIFVNRFNGDALCTNGKIVSGNRKLWQVFGRNPEQTKTLFAQEYEAALKSDGDFINYTANKLSEPDREFPKVSFIYGLPELQWLIGAGVYLDEIENQISVLQAQVKNLQYAQVRRTSMVTGILVILVLFLFYLVSNRLRKDLALCVENFVDVAHNDKEIGQNQIYFEEFSQLVEHSNSVLQDKKIALEELRLSEEKYRNIFDTAMVGLFRSRLADGLCLDVNQKAAIMFGGTRVADVVGKVKSIDLFQDINQRHRLLSELEKKGQVDSFKIDFILPERGEVHYSISAKVYPDKGYMEGVAVDITERMRAEKLLEESELRFRELADLLPVVVYEVDIEHNFTYVNLCAYKLFGYTEDDFVRGLKAYQIFAPEEQQRIKDNIAALYRGEEIGGVEYLALRKDGSKFPILANSNPIVRDGKISGRRGVVIDLSERKQAEEEILKLRKLESIGLLAGGIAHDFNNLLAGIFGNIELAKRYLSEPDKAGKYLESAEMSMERATSLTRQLLTFAKGGDPVKEIFSLSEMFAEVAGFSLRGSNVKLKLDIAKDLWMIDADKGQLGQVISNLVINAKQAMPSGGIVTISAVNLATTEGKQIQIVVQDQGVGIAPQHLDKIFDPYFSTKQQGSGLGLASTYSIINKHNGTILVKSELNQGTRFTITLPALQSFEKLVEDDSEHSSSSSHADPVLKILILDDEELIREVCAGMLKHLGHQVDCAIHGEEALELYKAARERSQDYDMVLCDLTIPGGMGGQEFAREISKIDPQAKLIVSSGYANDPVMANYEKYGFRGRVAKPFRLVELKKELERVNFT